MGDDTTQGQPLPDGERARQVYGRLGASGVGIPARPKRAGQTDNAGKPFLQVWFRCVDQYRRVYRNADGSAYDAVCPICAKQCRFRVGTEGTSRRLFEVSC